MTKSSILAIVILGLLLSPSTWSEMQWYKGATHVHSLWSDGNGSPEIIADWYKENGWDFVCFSEHNILMKGEKFVTIDAPKGHLTQERFAALQKRFGTDWTVTRELNGERQMRLKTLEELSAHFNEAGKFLFIPAEEMTSSGGSPHMNVLNVRELVPGASKDGDNVSKMQLYIDTIEAQKANYKVPMLVHLNHPNWSYPVTTKEMIAVRGFRFFEVYNGAGVYDRGNPALGMPSTERHWDVILSMKLRRDPNYLLYGVAADDSHHYFDFRAGKLNPGRGWVMVRADQLEAGTLIEAMQRGDFYGSTGVALNDLDRNAKHLAVEIAGEAGVVYTTRYIGTKKGFDTTSKPRLDSTGVVIPQSSLIYSDTIGVLLYETTDLKSQYTFTGDELYVRATIISDKPMTNPPAQGDVEMAWVQPVLPG